MIVVYYDLETTGLSNSKRHKGDLVQIVQIGAVTHYGQTFVQNIVPTCEISDGAIDVHGISKVHDKLFKNGRALDATDPQSGLKNFLAWIESLYLQECPYSPLTACLVSHNNLGYDSKVLKNCMALFGVRKPKNFSLKLTDSLEIMRGK